MKDSAEESLFVDGKKVMTQTGKNETLANNESVGQLCYYYFQNGDHFTQYDLAELMIFAVVGLLIGLVIRIPFVKLNHFVEKRMEDTKMM